MIQFNILSISGDDKDDCKLMWQLFVSVCEGQCFVEKVILLEFSDCLNFCHLFPWLWNVHTVCNDILAKQIQYACMSYTEETKVNYVEM